LDLSKVLSMRFSEKQPDCLTASTILPTARTELLARLREQMSIGFDLLVVGGGATGLGLALDASLRGFSVCLIEAKDFAQGTSSKATKLVHGGVRYLAQGRIGLVRQALHERTVLHANAPHLVSALPFVMPAYSRLDQGFYGLGLKAYDWLAGSHSLGDTSFLNATQTLSALPHLQHQALGQSLKGGVQYWDAHFDDARLALALARTAAQQGALVLNHVSAQSLIYDAGRVTGLVALDAEEGRSYRIHAACVVNATGVWADGLRQQDAAQSASASSVGAGSRPLQAHGDALPALLEPSQGVHLVVKQALTDGQHALLVPKTQDGRVLFAVPWLGHTLLGTTDTPRPEWRGEHIPYEPPALAQEVDFILNETNRYFQHPERSKPAVERSDVSSIWAGLRPLVKPQGSAGGNTQAVSREHHIEHSASGLVTVTGGKWTTYRVMAEDVLTHCFEHSLLPKRGPSVSAEFALVGKQQFSSSESLTSHAISQAPGLHLYGSEASIVQSLPGADAWLQPGLSEAMLRFAVRYEYARTVGDLLARRSRLLFLDAHAAQSIAPRAAQILREELGRSPEDDRVGEAAFAQLARGYATAIIKP
jgi:glycerol-3-phosphate dehydrogenase